MESPRPLGTFKVLSTPEIGPGEFVDLTPRSRDVAVSAPKSFAAKQYGILKRKLYHTKQERALTTLLITSAKISEGKTLTAVNLALTMAQDVDCRVLLVDTNLGQSHIEPVLGLSADQGLVDYLMGKRSNEKIIRRTSVSNLSIVCSGREAQGSDGSLNSQSMSDFLAYVKQRFDWVILDAPPYLPLANVDLISSLVDGILIVVRHSTTALNLISENTKVLSGRKLLGCIFNGVPARGRTGRRQLKE